MVKAFASYKEQTQVLLKGVKSRAAAREAAITSPAIPHSTVWPTYLPLKQTDWGNHVRIAGQPHGESREDKGQSLPFPV